MAWSRSTDARSGGLLPAVVQNAGNQQVLMLGWMSRESLQVTLDTGWVTFHSRSRGRLWTKGETSGHRLALASVETDCDGDTLLVQARPQRSDEPRVGNGGVRTCRSPCLPSH